MMYEDPGGIIAGAVIMQVVVTLCITMRFYTRRWQRTKVLTADWLILAAFICGIGLTWIEIYGVSIEALAYPLNGTIEDPRAVTGRLNKTKHLELSYLLLGVLALGLIKISASFLYWHLFAQVRFRRFLILWIVILIGWTTTFILAGLLECGSHLKALFATPEEYLHRCGSAIPSGWAYVGSDMATDFITLVIPIPIVISLRLPTSRKLLVLATFMIGGLSVGASIAKAHIYIQATLGKYNEDAILILTGISIWNLAEVQIGIIAACGPTLRPILNRSMQTANAHSSLRWMRGLKSTKRGTEDSPSFVNLESGPPSLGPFDRGNKQLSQAELYQLNFTTEKA